MPALDQNVKVTCGNCATSVTKQQLSRQKSRCSGVILFCPKCPNFSTNWRDDLYCHFVKKHAAPREKNTRKCKICFKEFSGFYALRQHKTREHGIQMKSPEFDAKNLVEDDDADLKEELEACQHFLVDSELEKGGHRFFNYSMSIIDNTLISKKLHLVFKGLNCVAKVNLAFGFDDITNLKEKLQNMDIVDLCTRERANTQWKFYKLTNLAVFAALLKVVPMGCKILYYLNRSWKIKMWIV